jgi:protoporphyrinogen oxidase
LHTLGLDEEIIFTSRQEPAAQNRYLYRGGNKVDELFKVPNRLIPGSYEDAWQLLTFIAPILRHVPGAFFSQFPDRDSVFQNQRPGEEDVSLGEFMSWIVGKDFVDQTMSGVIHGIYGADIYALSAREVFADKANLVDLYANGYIKGVKDAWFGRGVEMYPDGPSGVYAPPGEPFFKTLVENDRIGIPSADFKVLAGQILDSADSNWGQFRPLGPGVPRPGGSYLNDMARRSAFASIEGGLQTLVDRLARVLSMSGVNIQINSPVTGLEPAKGKVTVV